MKIIANEFVIPMCDGKDCHASHFIILNDGRVFGVFFYGSAEGKDDVRIFGSFRSVDGKWSEPAPLTEDDGVPHWNPVLHRASDGRIFLFYKVGKKIPQWKTYYKVFTDECNTFGDACEAVLGDTSGGRGPVRNKILTLDDGTWIAPASTEQGEWRCFFDISRDQGKNWIKSEMLCAGEVLAEEILQGKKRGIIQPALWQSSCGVHALMRSTFGKLYRSDSADGVNWCKPYPTQIPNNNSGVDTVSLPDGRVVLACNPVSDNWGKRTPMSLFISEDNGKSFELLTHLTTMQGEYSYPALRYENVFLHVSYTWNRKTVQYFCLQL